MAYKLNKTDGSLLVDLVDGRLDISSADIALVGKNYQGFGESINENFIKMLENFSNSTAPVKPLRGQLWYDTATGRLKIYDGTTFRSTDSTLYASSQPSELIAGDIWIDGSKDQLLFYNGTETVLVGPGYTKNQLRSGDFVETIRSTLGENKVVVKKYLNGSLYAVVSKEAAAFTPFPAITGFDTLKQGYNLSSVFSDFEWYGKASSAGKIIDQFGNVFDANSFISATVDDISTGKLTIANDNGLVVGLDSDVAIKVSGQTTVWQNNIQDADMRIDLKDVSGTYSAMYFDADTKRIGIFKTNPAYTLDVTGDLRITGDLIVEGVQVSLDVATLRVEDKQIELGIMSDSTLISEIDADDAGVVVRVAGDDKRWTWRNATNSWTSSNSINIENNLNSYFIGAANVLSQNTLGTTVINSSLTGIGQLNTLVVGNNLQSDTMTFTEDRITTTSNLEFASTGSINLINKVKITNVEKPISAREVSYNALLTEGAANDVAVKKYVDDELAASQLTLAVDVTGIGSSYATGAWGAGGDETLITNLVTMITELITPSGDINGKTAKIHAYYYTATTAAIDINANTTKTLQAVDSAGTQNVNVIGDFTITSPTAAVNFTVNRLVVTISVAAGLWETSTGVIAASAV
tara:strand:- start:2153 stop:4063 length:1911 start_codon:yes stop_codon:yes gene_type:complete